jgi:hypothetical protein
MFQTYRPADSNINYAIKLTADGVHIFDSSTRRRTFVDGEFDTIHQALGIYLLRQFRVDDAYGVLMQGAFDCPE